eukprot:scaffold269512_cov31-Tisochrysis_lutea.AAC.4
MALPLALIVDAIKSKAMARLSSAIEALKREEKAMEAKRARVQARPDRSILQHCYHPFFTWRPCLRGSYCACIGCHVTASFRHHLCQVGS